MSDYDPTQLMKPVPDGGEPDKPAEQAPDLTVAFHLRPEQPPTFHRVVAPEEPAGEAPANEAPIDEAPAGDMPVDINSSSKLFSSISPVDEAPADEVPAGEFIAGETPVDLNSSSKLFSNEVPVDKAPADEAPAGDMPVDINSSSKLFSSEVPAAEAPAAKDPATEAPAGGMPVDLNSSSKLFLSGGEEQKQMLGESPSERLFPSSTFGSERVAFTVQRKEPVAPDPISEAQGIVEPSAAFRANPHAAPMPSHAAPAGTTYAAPTYTASAAAAPDAASTRVFASAATAKAASAPTTSASAASAPAAAPAAATTVASATAAPAASAAASASPAAASSKAAQGQAASSRSSSRPQASIWALAGLIVALIALFTCWMPTFSNAAFVLGLIGFALAVVGLVGIAQGKKVGRGIAVAAIVIGALASMMVPIMQNAQPSSPTFWFNRGLGADAAMEAAGPDYANLPVGQTVDLENGLSVTLNSVNSGLTNYDGTTVLAINVTYVNHSEGTLKYNIYDWKGEKLGGEQVGEAIYNEPQNRLSSGNLSPGASKSGTIYFPGDTVRAHYYVNSGTQSAPTASWNLM